MSKRERQLENALKKCIGELERLWYVHCEDVPGRAGKYKGCIGEPDLGIIRRSKLTLTKMWGAQIKSRG